MPPSTDPDNAGHVRIAGASDGPAHSLLVTPMRWRIPPRAPMDAPMRPAGGPGAPPRAHGGA
ncbi:hypothetical protein STENM223S_02916 [Streptomyces tendae]